jgi:acyl-CoA synthetase (AMP-forming)/AMP-acid ligase II
MTGPNPLERVTGLLQAGKVLVETGIFRPVRPDHLIGMALAAVHWGLTPAAIAGINAVRFGNETAVIDEDGRTTFAELDRRTNALTNAWRRDGMTAEDAAGVLARNHLGFVETTIALSKLGADTLYLNTGFARPQLAEVLDREGAKAVVHDAEFTGLVAEASGGRRTYVADHLDEVITSASTSPPRGSGRTGRQVILTSGTTGTPKGAHRGVPTSVEPAVALLSRIPLRIRSTTLISAPMFHAWGLAHLTSGLALAHTLVLQRRFDPEAALAAIERERIDTWIVIPVMLQRVMELPEAVRRRYDTSSLRVVASSGSNLPGELARHFMDAFGDVLYNLYGSTEVAWATIATPEDLRTAPGTAGRPPRGTVVKLLDEAGREVGPGQPGRIFVANGMTFEGYTGGGTKEVRDGLMSTGDTGRWDDDGRLFVEGRDDDMIVSGGENVFPREVEDLLDEHPDIADCAVVGVPDDTFGQRLKAAVVLSPGASLSEDDVRGYVKKHLARYKVPRDVVFLPEIPRNSTGKILRGQLRG